MKKELEVVSVKRREKGVEREGAGWGGLCPRREYKLPLCNPRRFWEHWVEVIERQCEGVCFSINSRLQWHWPFLGLWVPYL